jgi:hypothetical protein
MDAAQHPAAGHSIPWFITAPGESDTLFAFATVVVIATILGLGVVFFRLHSLPERLGHKKLQFEIVAVLGLLSLFTHIHLFWVAGLLLALIDLPDFTGPLKRMARSLERISGAPAEDTEAPATLPAKAAHTEATSQPAPVAAKGLEPAIADRQGA